MTYDEMPPAVVRWKKGHWWYQIPNGDDWLHLGICPAPRTTWQVIRYHILHGLLMNYPLLSVLRFAWRNRNSFNEVVEVRL